MKRRVAVLFFLAAAMHGVLFAGDAERNWYCCTGDLLALKAVNLPAVKQEKIRLLREEYVQKAEEIRNQITERQYQLRGKLQDPATGDDTIRAVRHEVDILEDRYDEEKITYHVAIRTLLTSAQRVRVEKSYPGFRSCFYRFDGSAAVRWRSGVENSAESSAASFVVTGVAGASPASRAQAAPLPDPLPPLPPASRDFLVQGEAIYEAQCAGCHKLGTFDETGSPDLSGAGERVTAMLSAGSHMGRLLAPKQIGALAAFLDALRAPASQITFSTGPAGE